MRLETSFRFFHYLTRASIVATCVTSNVHANMAIPTVAVSIPGMVI